MEHIDVPRKLKRETKKYDIFGAAKAESLLPEEFIGQKIYKFTEAFLAIEEKLNTYYKLDRKLRYYFYHYDYYYYYLNYSAERFEVVFSETANNDLQKLTETFMQEGKQILNSYRFMQGLLEEMLKMRFKADEYPFKRNKNFIQYGSNLRHLNYKKSMVIFTIINYKAYIFRIMPLAYYSYS